MDRTRRESTNIELCELCGAAAGKLGQGLGLSAMGMQLAGGGKITKVAIQPTGAFLIRPVLAVARVRPPGLCMACRRKALAAYLALVLEKLRREITELETEKGGNRGQKEPKDQNDTERSETDGDDSGTADGAESGGDGSDPYAG